jgi:hypothetical protein
MTATINNNTVSMNTQDVLPVMLRMMDPEELARYDDLTPTCLDYLGNYRDGVNELPFFIDRLPGTAVASRTFFEKPTTRTKTGWWIPVAAPVLRRGSLHLRLLPQQRPGLRHEPPRRSRHHAQAPWKLQDSGHLGWERRCRDAVPTIDDTEVYVQFEVTEPLLLSPFIFGSGEGKQGFYGIQTMNFQMNMLSNAQRAWRCVRFGADFTRNVVVERFRGLHPAVPIPHAPCLRDAGRTQRGALLRVPCLPHHQLPRDCWERNWNYWSQRTLLGGRSAVLNSSNIQLNGIPDKLVIFVRKNMGNLDCRESDKYLTIKGIRINFNNQAGLLASQSPQQLYQNSVLSGLHMSWEQFSGLTTSVAGRPAAFGNTSEPYSAYTGVGATFTSAYNTAAADPFHPPSAQASNTSPPPAPFWP